MDTTQSLQKEIDAKKKKIAEFTRKLALAEDDAADHRDALKEDPNNADLKSGLKMCLAEAEEAADEIDAANLWIRQLNARFQKAAATEKAAQKASVANRNSGSSGGTYSGRSPSRSF